MIWRWYLLINFGFIIYSNVISGSLSQLVRDRSVQCNSNQMLVTLEFVQPFLGVVYTNKFYQNKDCKWNGNVSRQIQVPIPLNTNPTSQPYCGVQLKESTGEFSVTLIISPMKGVLVDGMEGLTIRCLYNIGDVTLTLPAGSNGAGILISHQTQAGIVTGTGGNPFLQMAIRDGHGINGDIIQSAEVGQRISLDVVMKDTTIYDFYVHDCYAHDGTNTPEASISIVDSNGCAVRLGRAVDVPVFTTAPIPNGAKHVYVHMYGFQFTTNQLVYFECQIRPCLQACNRAQCINGNGFTEISTSAQRIRREVNSLLDNSVQETYTDNYNLTTVIRIEAQDLISVIPAARDSPNEVDSERTLSSDLCISIGIGVTILVIFIIVCAISFAISILLCHRAYKESKSNKIQSLPTNIYSYSSPTPFDHQPTGSSRRTMSSAQNLRS